MAVDAINSHVRYVDNNYDPYNLTTRDFLKIYLKMLKLQDPTEPLKVEDMIQQNYLLQQISFLTNLEETLQNLLNAQKLSYITQASFLIGKNVVFQTNTITDPSADYVLQSPQDYINAEISVINNAPGEVVKSYTTDLVKGINPLQLDDLPAGEYRVTVSRDGQTLNDVILGIEGTVQYVSLSGDEPVLGLPFGEKPLKDVVYIST
jgi:flagellar hook assembly protein FlgD